MLDIYNIIHIAHISISRLELLKRYKLINGLHKARKTNKKLIVNNLSYSPYSLLTINIIFFFLLWFLFCEKLFSTRLINF